MTVNLRAFMAGYNEAFDAVQDDKDPIPAENFGYPKGWTPDPDMVRLKGEEFSNLKFARVPFAVLFFLLFYGSIGYGAFYRDITIAGGLLGGLFVVILLAVATGANVS